MLHKHLLGLGLVAMLMTISAPDVKAQPTATKTQPTEVKSSPTTKTAQGNIFETAQSAGSFKTLIKAVEAAGLQKALQDEGPMTVLAPTDAAFAKLPKGQLASLLKKENRGKLRKILTYHIIPEKILSKDLIAKGNNAGTVRSSNLTFKQSGKKITVNGASIVKADIVASNGVIHSIDKVLMPK